MNKYDLVLDIIRHPENYTSEQLAEIMSDSETRETYTLLCKTDTVYCANNEPNIKAEWERFSHNHNIRDPKRLVWFGSHAASIIALIGASIVAVAAGIGVTVAVLEHKAETVTKHDTVATIELTETYISDSTRNDSSRIVLKPIIFENQSLEAIMNIISEKYDVKVNFNNSTAASLHLYYKLDPSMPLNKVIEQLNTFEQINIKQNGNILNIN